MAAHRRYLYGLCLCLVFLLVIVVYWNTQTKLGELKRINPRDPIATETFAADPLFGKIRVLCLVTYKYWYTDAARYVKHTWGKHCNVLLLVSGQPDLELEPYVPVVNGSDNWIMVRQGFIYAYEYYRHDADWFLKIEDWSFVVVENLRFLLQKFSPDDPIYLGYELKHPDTNYSSNYWKAGYVLSREALRRYTAEAKKPEAQHCINKPDFEEGTEMARCLRHVGVSTVDTRDELGHHTFIPIDTSKVFLAGYGEMPWLRNMSLWPTEGHTVAISRRAITFYVSYPPKLIDLYYFGYKVHIFGKPERNSMEVLS